jgi:hypothetical protein
VRATADLGGIFTRFMDAGMDKYFYDKGLQTDWARPWLRMAALTILFLAGALPSSTLFGFHVRHMVLVLFMILLGFWCVKGRDSVTFSGMKPVIVGGALVLLMTIWLSIAHQNYPEDGVVALTQWKGIVGSIMIPTLVVTLWRFRLLTATEFWSAFLAAAIFIAVMKVSLIAVVAVTPLSIDTAMGWFAYVFGIGPITMRIAEDVHRIFIVNDAVVVFALYLVLSGRVFHSGNGVRWSWLILLLLILSIVLSYSRVLWAVALGLSLLGIFESENIRARLARLVHLSIAFVLAIFILTQFLGDITQPLVSRYAGEATIGSDNVRLQQIDYLWAGFSEKYYFGWGLGSYLHDYIRSDTTAFSYEVQWMAYLYQFGIVGVLLQLSAMLLVPFLGANSGTSRRWWFAAAAYLAWLMMPFTNSYFGNTTAGLVFAMFAMLFMTAGSGENSRNQPEPGYRRFTT